jgi:hypothetical protein
MQWHLTLFTCELVWERLEREREREREREGEEKAEVRDLVTSTHYLHMIHVQGTCTLYDQVTLYLHKDDGRKVRFFLHHERCHIIEAGWARLITRPIGSLTWTLQTSVGPGVDEAVLDVGVTTGGGCTVDGVMISAHICDTGAVQDFGTVYTEYGSRSKFANHNHGKQ